MKRTLLTALCILAVFASAAAQDDVQKATANALMAFIKAPDATPEEEKPQYWAVSSQFDLRPPSSRGWYC